MTPLQQAQLALGETRRKLAEAIAAAEPDTSVIENLTTEVRAQDAKATAMMLLEPDNTQVIRETGEGREMRHLLANASLGRMMTGIANDEAGAGADAELRQHLHLPANYVPWHMIAENRTALAMTGDEDGNVTPWINTVFPESAAAFCGVDVTTVAVGEVNVPVVGTGLTITFPGENTAPAESAPDAAVNTLTPRGARGFFPVSKTDLLKYPMLEDAWRMEMNAAIANALDKDLLTLAAKGLLAHGTTPTNPTDETTAAEYLAAIYAGVDGTYASGPGQVRLLVGGTIYTHMAGLLVNTGSTTELSVAEKVGGVSGGLFVSGNVNAYANNRQDAVVVKGPPRRNAVAVMWNGVEVIRDELTQASKGQVIFNVAAWADFEVLRGAGFIRHRFRNS